MQHIVRHIADVGGGMVDGIPATDLNDNQFENLLNWFPFGTKLVRRGGLRRLTTTPAATPITNMLTFAGETENTVLLGLEGGFGKLVGGAVVPIPKADGSFANMTLPWSMVQYKGAVFAVRPGEVLHRLTTGEVQKAGVLQPSAAPSLANGGGGNITPGQYTYFVTFLTSGGDRSPESAEATITLGVNSQVNLTNVVVSSQAHVIAREIWRTLPNDAGQAYRVTILNDNTTTVFTDNVANDSLGEPFEYGNLVPPATPAYSLERWNERLWMHDEQALYATRAGRFETFAETFEGFDQYSGQKIRALHAWDERLVVGTTGKIFTVVQTGVDESGVRFDIEELTSDHGCVAHHSMKSAEGALFWWAGDNVYMSAGGRAQSITTQSLRALMGGARSDRYEHAVAAIDARRGWYMLSFSKDSATENDTLAVYNYKTDKWHTFSYFGNTSAPGALMDFFDVNFQVDTYAAFGGNVYEAHVDLDDDDELIRAVAKGKAFQVPGNVSIVRKLQVNCTSVAGEMTAQLYRDGSSDPGTIHTRTVSLNQPRDWKRLALANAGGPQTGTSPRKVSRTFQVELIYEGRPEVEISELLLEVDSFEHRGTVL